MKKDEEKKDEKNKEIDDAIRKKSEEGKNKPESEFEQCKKLNKEYLGTLQRLQAEFENYKKRSEKENEGYRKFAIAELARKLLPVLDSFELALKNNNDLEKFKKGVELIFAQFYSILEETGLKKIDCINSKFDPYRHEVLMVEENSKCQDETIVEEFQKGYLFRDEVLRHSKVKIARNEHPSQCKKQDDEKKIDEKNNTK